jgi:hypothetical protein
LRGGISGENYRGQYQQELDAPRHRRQRPRPSGILGGDAMDRLAARLSATTDAGRFAGLSTRTLGKYRYKGPTIVEIMPNPDGPLSVDPEGGVSRRPTGFFSASLREAAKRQHIAAQ